MIFPNPVTTTLTINNYNYLYNNIKIIDINGKIWKELEPTVKTVSVQDLPNGVYVLLMEGDQFRRFKFIKE